MIVPVPRVQDPAEQDKGIAHCHYIRQLANEIWCKENDKSTNKKMDWENCIRRALLLHRRKLVMNQVDRIVPLSRRIGW